VNSEQRVANQIAAATARRAAHTAQRTRRQLARRHGLDTRHRQKLARLNPDAVSTTDTTPTQSQPDPDGSAA